MPSPLTNFALVEFVCDKSKIVINEKAIIEGPFIVGSSVTTKKKNDLEKRKKKVPAMATIIFIGKKKDCISKMEEDGGDSQSTSSATSVVKKVVTLVKNVLRKSVSRSPTSSPEPKRSKLSDVIVDVHEGSPPTESIVIATQDPLSISSEVVDGLSPKPGTSGINKKVDFDAIEIADDYSDVDSDDDNSGDEKINDDADDKDETSTDEDDDDGEDNSIKRESEAISWLSSQKRSSKITKVSRTFFRKFLGKNYKKYTLSATSKKRTVLNLRQRKSFWKSLNSKFPGLYGDSCNDQLKARVINSVNNAYRDTKVKEELQVFKDLFSPCLKNSTSVTVKIAMNQSFIYAL